VPGEGVDLFKKIIGADLLPGESPISSREPHFAYVVMVDGTIKEKGAVSLSELLAIAQRTRADAIAVDNVYELAPSLEELQRMLNSLTHTPKLVQVTMIGGKMYQLSSLAASLGLSGGKLSPEQAAETCAQLCFMGVGSELVLFESNETRVIVSKGRQPVQGGMSVERYRRNIESRILIKTKEIKNILDSKKIDYDMFITKSSYGLERSVFIVYAPRDELFGVIKPIHDHDIQVRVELVEKREPTFNPLASRPRKTRKITVHLIVGVDPGVTTGIAAVTLDGELRLLISGKELGRGQVVRILSEVGSPVVVATDTSPPPEYVKKLATMLNATLVAPQRPLTVEEKRRLVSDFMGATPQNFKVKDAHQRDALAAAINAYLQLRPKLIEAREKVYRLGLDIPLEDVEALVAKGSAIWDAIRQVSRTCLVPGHEQLAPKAVSKTETFYLENLLDRLNDAYKRIQKLENEKESLIEKIKLLEEQYNRILNIQNYELKKDKEIESLKIKIDMLLKENNLLEEELNKIKNRLNVIENLIAKAASGEFVFVPRVGSLDPASDLSRTGGVVVVGALRPDDLKHLREIRNKFKLKALICEQIPSGAFAADLASFDIALLSFDEIRPVDRVRDVYVFKRVELEKAIVEKLQKLEKESHERTRKTFKDIVESYRIDRARLIKAEGEVAKQ
jgi:predicted RNase H-like nuclease (RuvC/YqgF family)